MVRTRQLPTQPSDNRPARAARVVVAKKATTPKYSRKVGLEQYALGNVVAVAKNKSAAARRGGGFAKRIKAEEHKNEILVFIPGSNQDLESPLMNITGEPDVVKGVVYAFFTTTSTDDAIMSRLTTDNLVDSNTIDRNNITDPRSVAILELYENNKPASSSDKSGSSYMYNINDINDIRLKMAADKEKIEPSDKVALSEVSSSSGKPKAKGKGKGKGTATLLRYFGVTDTGNYQRIKENWKSTDGLQGKKTPYTDKSKFTLLSAEYNGKRYYVIIFNHVDLKSLGDYLISREDTEEMKSVVAQWNLNLSGNAEQKLPPSTEKVLPKPPVSNKVSDLIGDTVIPGARQVDPLPRPGPGPRPGARQVDPLPGPKPGPRPGPGPRPRPVDQLPLSGARPGARPVDQLPLSGARPGPGARPVDQLPLSGARPGARPVDQLPLSGDNRISTPFKENGSMREDEEGRTLVPHRIGGANQPPSFGAQSPSRSPNQSPGRKVGFPTLGGAKSLKAVNGKTSEN
jgi:hypothetical protein